MMHGILGRCRQWSHDKSIGLLALRIVLGAFFIAHGISKFQNLEAVKMFFQSLGLGQYWAPIVASAELLSGIALILGAFVWPAAIAITAIMAVAIVKVTSNGTGDALTGFIAGWGPNVIYAAAALCIAWCGAGRWSLTRWYLKRKSADCQECMKDHHA